MAKKYEFLNGDTVSFDPFEAYEFLTDDAKLLYDKFNEPEEIKDKIQFPIEIFPEFIRDYAKVLDFALNYDRAFTLTSLMSVIGGIAGNKNRIDAAGKWTTPALFWFAIVSEPGAIKSHPVENMLNPLIDLNKDFFHNFKIESEIFEENESKAAKDPTKERLLRPRLKQIIVQNITVESAFKVHGINTNSILAFNDELMSWVNSMGQYKAAGKSNDKQFWLSSFNNSFYSINRVNSDPIMLDKVNINIIGTIQPTEINKITETDGLLHRFLFTDINTEKKPLSRKNVDSSVKQEYYQKIYDYYFEVENQTEITQFQMTDSAIDKYFEIDKYLTDLQNDNKFTVVTVNYISKLKTYLPRFALILQLIDYVFGGIDNNYGYSVDLKHLVGAEKLVNYFLKTAMRTFENKEQIKELQRVAYGKGETKKETILRMYKQGIKQSGIAKMLSCSKPYVSKTIKDEFIKS
jgi:hypothetical protein